VTLLDELNALGIRLKVDGGKLFVAGALTPELATRLKAERDEVREAVWVRQGRVRQALALKRLAEDRGRWVEECKRLGKYRGPEPSLRNAPIA
jgi:hypothetical protein